MSDNVKLFLFVTAANVAGTLLTVGLFALLRRMEMW